MISGSGRNRPKQHHSACDLILTAMSSPYCEYKTVTIILEMMINHLFLFVYSVRMFSVGTEMLHRRITDTVSAAKTVMEQLSS